MAELINVECSRGSCVHNNGTECKFEYLKSGERVDPSEWPDHCDKDFFRCKQCGYEKMKKDPLDTHACPKCGTTKWDIEPVHCFKCGHEWVPQDIEPGKVCPECGGEV